MAHDVSFIRCHHHLGAESLLQLLEDILAGEAQVGFSPTTVVR
ncbi:MAG TPA: hypothetical protein VMF03_17040 [Steroidobacteraceae bacterium]|nr:hypothetical protein [Steroidobacteraceae bacterium]